MCNVARYVPAVLDGDDTAFPLSDFHECRLGHIKVFTRWVAPSPIVGILTPVWRAKVCSGNGSHWVPGVTPFGVHAKNLVALPACISIVK